MSLLYNQTSPANLHSFSRHLPSLPLPRLQRDHHVRVDPGRAPHRLPGVPARPPSAKAPWKHLVGLQGTKVYIFCGLVTFHPASAQPVPTAPMLMSQIHLLFPKGSVAPFTSYAVSSGFFLPHVGHSRLVQGRALQRATGRQLVSSPPRLPMETCPQLPAVAVLMFYCSYMWAFCEGVPISEKRNVLQVGLAFSGAAIFL